MANYASLALALSRQAWGSYREFRNRKEEQAYDALEKAAAGADQLTEAAKAKGQEIFADPSGEADKVIQQAKRRLENAKSALQEGSKDFTAQAADAQREALDKGKKVSKRVRRRIEKASGEAAKKAQARYDKAAAKASKKAQKAADAARAKVSGEEKKKRCCCKKALGIVALLSLVGAVVGGVAAWWKSRKDTNEEPPRVEEYSRPGASRLVYSTQTGTGSGASAAAAPATSAPAEPAEPAVAAEPAEDDDEQEGRHRLREDREVIETRLPETHVQESSDAADSVEAEYHQPGIVEDDAEEKKD